MDELDYVECQNCGAIHYVISEKEAEILIKSGALFDEFSARNLECCTSCGLKNRFSMVSKYYTDNFSQGDKIPPILLKNEESKQITTTGTKN